MRLVDRMEWHWRHGLALLALYLLFGLLFAQALAYVFSIPWSRGMTVGFYGVAAIWGMFLAWALRARLRPAIGLQNVLFAAFMLMMLASIIFSSRQGPVDGKAISYMPFMVALPYVCGSLMRPADIRRLRRWAMVAAWVMLPLLLLDRLVWTTDMHSTRWPFFGLNHGPLLIGALMAVATAATCVSMIDRSRSASRTTWGLRLWQAVQLAVMVVGLVWVSARGWLLAGLASGAMLCLLARHTAMSRRIVVLLMMAIVAVASWKILPNIDARFGGIYKQVGESEFDTRLRPGLDQRMLESDKPMLESGKPMLDSDKPMLGDASCDPFRKGVNSIEMRWVLYQEAVAMFLENPVVGVGTARFGYHSCTGPAGYPHSTVLQAFAELGLIGGGIYVALLGFVGVGLLRRVLARKVDAHRPDALFLLGLFIVFVLADQIYGNYLMAVGSWMVLGMGNGMGIVGRARSENIL